MKTCILTDTLYLTSGQKIQTAFSTLIQKVRTMYKYFSNDCPLNVWHQDYKVTFDFFQEIWPGDLFFLGTYTL
jgi:hypothetical protein